MAPDLSTYGAAGSACERGPAVSEGPTLSYGRCSASVPIVFTYCEAVHAGEKGRPRLQDLYLLRAMQCLAIVPVVLPHCAAVSACEKVQPGQQA